MHITVSHWGLFDVMFFTVWCVLECSNVFTVQLASQLLIFIWSVQCLWRILSLIVVLWFCTLLVLDMLRVVSLVPASSVWLKWWGWGCVQVLSNREKECGYWEIREICHIDLEVRADSKLVLGQNPEDQSLNTQCCETQKVETLSWNNFWGILKHFGIGSM